MRLLNWIYVSRSCIGSGDGEIEQIVQRAQSKNAALQVTGVLVFDGTHFAQFLEGAEASVEKLRSAIEADNRHEDVRTILYEAAQERRLADWSLAYSGRSLVVTRAIRRALRDVEHEDPAAGARLLSMFISLAGADLLSSAP
jgi:hypothetical protein